MAVERVKVHCVQIEDKPGSLHRFLSQSSLSGVDFLCFAAFSCGENKGRVVVSAKDPKTFENFAREAKLKVTEAAGFIVDGIDRIGAAGEVLGTLAENDIAGIAGTAIACEGSYRMLIVVDSKNAERAEKLLK
jgi:hypothetical protein